MKSHLQTRSGVDWVVRSYEDWVFGKDRTPDVGGGCKVTSGEIARAVGGLDSIRTADGKIVKLGEVSIREAAGMDAVSCRLRKGTRLAEIWCTVVVDGVPSRNKTCVGRFPHMVDDGYFIVNGTEWAYVNREAQRFDIPMMWCRKGTFGMQVNSYNAPMRIVLKREFRIEIGFKPSVNLPLSVVVAALAGTDNVAVTNPDVSHAMNASWGAAHEDPIKAVGEAFMMGDGMSDKHIRELGVRAMREKLLPFLSCEEEKREYLIERAIELIEFQLGSRSETDVDALENKRIETAGKFVARSVSAGIREMWYKTRTKLEQTKCGHDAIKYMTNAADCVENMVCGAITKGGTGKDDRGASVLPRKANWQESIAVVRRVSANVTANCNVVGPRLFHGTAYGFYCACETQEGESTGLSRETALFFKCSLHGDPLMWRDLLAFAPIAPGVGRIYVNNSIRRRHVDLKVALEFCARIKRSIDPDASLVLIRDAIYVDVSEGRPMRPVWVARRGTTDDFDLGIREGKIEWMDPAQARVSYIATTASSMREYHTHLEFHPTSLLGPSASNIPFLDRNPGARNLFGSHVRHQAIGDPFPFESDRFDVGEVNRMWYRQRALCDTVMAREACGSHLHPCGWNAIIFVLATPRGQEDAIGISRRHVDLGGAIVESETSYYDVRSRGEKFGDVTRRMGKLDKHGIIRVGEIVLPGDVLVAKHVNGVDATTCVWNKKFTARVRAVRRVGDDRVMVRMAWTRIPEIGDKMATRHGQKGVFNFFILDDASWWTAEGLTPDLVLNPACFPTRQTIGNLFEMLSGKVNSLLPPRGFTEFGCEGSPTDCTPYSTDFDYEKVQSMLAECGYQRKGHEIVYNGVTGKAMGGCHVFTGPAFVQRLVHFSFPKCYARGRGTKNPNTGQPPKGRKNDGGLRLGEMETKAHQAYGAASALQTAFLDCSDGIEVSFCVRCKYDRTFRGSNCPACGCMETVVKVSHRTFMMIRDLLRVARIDCSLKF